MKTVLFVILVTLLSCSGNKKTVTSKQESKHSESYKSLITFKNDTLNYVKENFEYRKDKYIGQNIGYLIKDIEVPIIDVLFTGGNRKDIINLITLYLYDNRIANYNGHRTKIHISLSTPLNKKDFMDKRKGSPNKWCDKDFELIKDSQISDVTVVNFK